MTQFYAMDMLPDISTSAIAAGGNVVALFNDPSHSNTRNLFRVVDGDTFGAISYLGGDRALVQDTGMNGQLSVIDLSQGRKTLTFANPRNRTSNEEEEIRGMSVFRKEEPNSSIAAISNKAIYMYDPRIPGTVFPHVGRNAWIA